MGHLLAGSLEPWFSHLPGYQESIGVEHYQLLGHQNVGIVVPPGQEDRRPESWSDLHGQLRAGEIRGVILVSAYGYHSLRDQMTDHRLHPQEGPQKKERFLQAYLGQCRAAEVQILQNLAPFFPTTGRTWLLSVFSKADLRYGEERAFAEWYRESGYRQCVQEIQDSRGIMNFRHERVDAAFTIENFTDAGNSVIKPNAPGYDIPKFLNSLNHMANVIEELCRWEDQS